MHFLFHLNLLYYFNKCFVLYFVRPRTLIWQCIFFEKPLFKNYLTTLCYLCAAHWMSFSKIPGWIFSKILFLCALHSSYRVLKKNGRFGILIGVQVQPATGKATLYYRLWYCWIIEDVMCCATSVEYSYRIR